MSGRIDQNANSWKARSHPSIRSKNGGRAEGLPGQLVHLTETPSSRLIGGGNPRTSRCPAPIPRELSQDYNRNVGSKLSRYEYPHTRVLQIFETDTSRLSGKPDNQIELWDGTAAGPRTLRRRHGLKPRTTIRISKSERPPLPT